MENIAKILKEINPDITIDSLKAIEEGDEDAISAFKTSYQNSIIEKSERRAAYTALKMIKNDTPDLESENFQNVLKSYKDNKGRVDWTKIEKEFPNLTEALSKKQKEIFEELSSAFEVTTKFKDTKEVAAFFKARLNSQALTETERSEIQKTIEGLQTKILDYEEKYIPLEKHNQEKANIYSNNLLHYAITIAQSYLEDSTFHKKSSETNEEFAKRLKVAANDFVQMVWSQYRIDENGDLISNQTNQKANTSIDTVQSVLGRAIRNKINEFGFTPNVKSYGHGEKNKTAQGNSVSSADAISNIVNSPKNKHLTPQEKARLAQSLIKEYAAKNQSI